MLEDSFGTLDDVERHKTSCAIFNARMQDGASITNHVLYMIELIERFSKLGFSLHKQLGKDEILNSLPKYYLLFLTHYRMSKPEVAYHGLQGLLQNFKKDPQLHKESVNLVGGSSSHSRFFGKEKKNKKKKAKKVHVHARTAVQAQTPKTKSDKSQAECFFCKKRGH